MNPVSILKSCLLVLGFCVGAGSAVAQPAFSKVFSPDTIGPGATSTLTFTIDNTSGFGPAANLAFTDNLPAGVTIADPSQANTTCSDNGGIVPTISAPEGGSTIAFSNASVGAGSSCTVSVNVTSATIGTHTNVSGALTSSQGTSGSATDDLNVVTTLPGFTKAFSPAIVPLGGVSTLTYTIDNTANTSAIGSLDFTETLPVGMVITSPSNASTTCVSSASPNTTLTANPGGSVVTLDANGFMSSGFETLPAGATCTVSLNVRATAVGVLKATSGDLLADFVSAGRSSADLDVTAAGLNIAKVFTDDPVSAGGSVTLEFTLQNFDRSQSATAVSFSDDLNATLAGLTFDSVLANDCGGTVGGTGTSLVTFSGGTIAAGASCTIRTSLSVPASAAGGNYTNTTSAITGMLGGSAVTGNTATDILVIPAGGGFPALTLDILDATTFAPNPTPNAGDDIVLRYTITNTSSSTAASDLADTLPLQPPLPFPATVTLPPNPNPPCGPGSALSLVALGFDQQGLSLTGGSLAPSASCSFDVTLSLPADLPGGTYSFAPDAPTATMDGATVSGTAAGDSVLVGAGADLTFSKSFSGPVAPGGTVDLTFDITPGADSATVTGVAFTDDLSAMLAGVTASGLPVSGCGGTLTGSAGDTMLSFSGGTVSAACSITVTLNVPASAAPGSYSNTTSTLSGSVGGAAYTTAAATDQLDVVGLDFSKAFIGSPVAPGGTMTLRYTIANVHPSASANITSFTDDLNAALSGLAASGAPTADTCGGTMSGTTSLTYSGGSVAAGASCIIEIPVVVPAAATANTYNSASGPLVSDLGTTGAASATFTVIDQLVDFRKVFTDDPAPVGGTATLVFTIDNLSGSAASGLTFTDDLNAMLPGALFDSVNSNSCGTATGIGTGVFTQPAFGLAAGSSCSISINVSVPSGSFAGSYFNTTSDLSGTVGGSTLPAGITASDTLNVTDQQPLTFTKSFATNPVVVGFSTDLTFSISNPNGADANGLRFSDDVASIIPGATFTNLPASACEGTITGAGTSRIDISGMSIAGTGIAPPPLAQSPDGSASTHAAASPCTFTVTLNIPETATPGTVLNTTSDLTDGATIYAGPATASLQIEPQRADLSIAVADSPDPVLPGSTLTYSVTVANAGPQTAKGAVATFAVPTGLTGVTTSGCAEDPAGTPTCSLGDIASGGNAVFTVSGTVPATAVGTLDATASVSSSTLDPLTTDNDVMASTTVTPVAALSVTKTDGITSIVAGQTLTYTITVANAGPATDPAVSLTDTFPAGLTCAYSSAASGGASGNTAAGSGNLSETLSMPAGSSVTYTASCDVAITTSGTLTNTATATASITEFDTSDNSATDGDTVVASPAPLGFAKAFGTDPIQQGETSTLTFTLTNSNPVAATGGAFSDTFPAAAGMTVAATPNLTNSCSTETVTPGASSVAFSAITVPASGSCTIAFDVTAVNIGTFTNTTSILTSNFPTASENAAATLTVNAADPLTIAKSFLPNSLPQGATTTATFDIGNTTNAIAAADVAFTDTLPAGLIVADTPGVTNSCGGSVTATAGSGQVALSGGMLAAGASCQITVLLDTTGFGTLTNPAFDVTSSTVPTGTAAATDLTVTKAEPLVVAKAFSPNAVPQGATTTATITIDNSANALDAETLAFTDTLPAGLIVADTPGVTNSCGGSVTATAGSGQVALSGGMLAAGASCQITVLLDTTTPGVLTNPAFAVTSSTIDSGTAAATDLTVTAAGAPGLSKVFSPATILQGQTTRATITVDNSANAIEMTGMAMTDTLPAGLIVAATPNLSNSCGGTATAAAGSGQITLSGGTLAAGGTCAIAVDLRALQAGTLTNPTFDLTSSIATGTAASVGLTVTPAAAPTVAKAFSPATILQGQTSTATITIDNTANFIDMANVAFTDALPAGLAVAATPNLSSTCGGTATAAAGSGQITLSGGGIPAGGSCAINVDLRATAAGTLTNPAFDVTSSIATGTAPAADLTVTPAAAPGFAKSFAPDTIVQGGVTQASFAIDNSASFIEATGLGFADPLPAGLVVGPSGLISNDCGGTVTAAPGANTVTLAGGTVAEMASCTVIVEFRALQAGTLTNPAFDLVSSLGNSTAAAAPLSVTPAAAPVVGKTFAPASINQGQETTATIAIDNSANLIEMTNLAFTDTLPAGLSIAATPNAANSCGGTLTADAGTQVISLSGGTLAEGATCEISVSLRATGAGTLTNPAFDVTSSIATATAAATDLNVAPAAPMGFAKSFAPSTIEFDGTTVLAIDIDNSANFLDATGIAFTDAFPAGMVVATTPGATNTCAGTLSASAGATQISLSGGALAAGATCRVTVNVAATASGTLVNTTGSLTSSLPSPSPAASASLVVNPPRYGFVSITVNGVDGGYGLSSANADLTRTVTVSGGTGSTGAIRTDAGSHTVAIDPPAGAAMTGASCDDANSSVDLATGTLSLGLEVLETVNCTITTTPSVQRTIDVINSFLTQRANLILSSEPNPNRRFDRLSRGFGTATRLSFTNGDLKAMLPFTAQISKDAYSFSTSLTQMREAAAVTRLAHGSPREFVENYRFDAWFEGQYKTYDQGAGGSGNFGIAYMGVDWLANDDLLVGAMLSFDRMEDSDSVPGSSISGTGWMFGPYITARIGQSLYFDARVAGGASNNKVSPFNTYTDRFDTTRWLATASLSGEFHRGAWTIRPAASLNYYAETQSSYVDNTGATIPSQRVELGQLKLGPTFTGRFEGDNGGIYAPYFSLDAIYNIGNTSGVTVTNPATPATEGWRGRLKAGVNITDDSGVRLGFGASYDGLFRSDYDVWGLTFELEIPLDKPKAR